MQEGRGGSGFSSACIDIGGPCWRLEGGALARFEIEVLGMNDTWVN